MLWQMAALSCFTERFEELTEDLVVDVFLNSPLLVILVLLVLVIGFQSI